MDNKLKCQVIMLPVVIGEMTLGVTINWNIPAHMRGQGFSLYFVSDEKIKEGDHYMNTIIPRIHKRKFDPTGRFLPTEFKKIEASTDKSLCLPNISQGFIEEYVEMQGKVKEVYIRTEWKYDAQVVETVLFDDRDKAPTRTEVIIAPVKNSWNREDMKEAYVQGYSDAISKRTGTKHSNFNEWFDQKY